MTSAPHEPSGCELKSPLPSDDVEVEALIAVEMYDGDGGWTISPDTLDNIQRRVEAAGWDAQWEAIEAVLLAVGAQQRIEAEARALTAEAALAKAVEDERGACAEVAVAHHPGSIIAREIAIAIRARTATPETERSDDA